MFHLESQYNLNFYEVVLCGFIVSVGMLGRIYEIAECSVTTTHHLPSCEFKLLCVRSCVRLNSLLTSALSLQGKREIAHSGVSVVLSILIGARRPPARWQGCRISSHVQHRWPLASQSAHFLADSQVPISQLRSVAGRRMRKSECAFVVVTQTPFWILAA